MILKAKEIMNKIDDEYRGFLEKRRDLQISPEKLAVEVEEILQEIKEAGKNIGNSKLRQQLESYAGSCGLYIYEVTNNYPNTSLDPLDKKIQDILTKYGEDGEIDVEEFLLSSLKKMDSSEFKETVIFVLLDKLTYYAYYGETLEPEELEELESKQLERAIACICQIAYLKSLQNIVHWLDEGTKTNWLNFFGHRYIYELFAEQIAPLEAWGSELKKLNKDRYINELETILFTFYDSKLAEALEQGLKSFILKHQDSRISSLLDELDGNIFKTAEIKVEVNGSKPIGRVMRNTNQFIIEFLKKGGDRTSYWAEQWLDELGSSGWKTLQKKCHYEYEDWHNLSIQEKIDIYLDQQSNKYDSIKEDLEEKIKGKFDKETVFHEPFTFKDIYIPLKVSESSFDLKHEVIKAIQGRDRRDQILCIEGETGSGKSIFCRKLADWTLKNLHPLWTPILIKLRDVKELGNNFQETLEIILDDCNFADNNDWLKDPNTCFLFLLDGLDELLTEQSPEGSWNTLLQQANKFQHEYGLDKKLPKHQVLITTRSIVFQGITLSVEGVERVKIQPIDQNFQQQWLEKWEKANQNQKVEKDLKVQALKEVSNAQLGESKDSTKGWLKEPLLLYLIAAMWRDGILNKQKIEGLEPDEIKITIYKRLLDWVIRTQIQDSHDPKLEPLQKIFKGDLLEQNKETFKRILTEAGLCAIQSGGIRSSMSILEERLDKCLAEESKEFAKSLFQEAKKIEEIKKKEKDESPTTVLLSIENNQVNFLHKSFSEFLYAQRLLQNLEDWTKLWDNGLEFLISSDRLDWEIYDLLGFGGLTKEIVGYLRGSLKDSQILSNKPERNRLFERLEDFYSRWFEGKFINEEISAIWPEKKMVELLKPKLLNPISNQSLILGRRLINIYTGLNVLILLLELSRQIQEKTKPFYPCGSVSLEQCVGERICRLGERTDTFEPSRLLRLIGYSRWLGTDVFVKTVGSFLEEINLRGADLRGAELSGVKLNKSYLSSSLLNGINLSQAELKQAFLGNAQLHCADLSGTNLTSTFLGNANLSGAYLEKAVLVRAVLAGANLRTAHLVNANIEDADLGDADLSDANLRGSNLKNANFSCANLSDANLQGADLSGANLTSANLIGCNVSGVDLTSANLTGTNLTKIISNEKTKFP
jgi:uncharacterized protein YjbI with pentapeptide repeats